jgi:hypothetical protein
MRPWTDVPTKKYDALGNDVTETGDFLEAKRVVEEREKLLSDLGLTEEATQAEIDEAKAKHAAELRYEMAKEIVAEYEEKHAVESGEPEEPEPPTTQETKDYNDAKAEIVAYEAAQEAAAAAPQPDSQANPV